MGQEKTGRNNPELISAMGAFGGGVASSGRICGILVGAVAFMSSLYSRSSLGEKDDPNMWRYGFKLNKKFGELCQEFGGMDCKDIARIDWRDRDAVKEFYHGDDSSRQHCIRLVGDIAEYMGELLEDAPPKKT